jgi:hypothetical protein
MAWNVFSAGSGACSSARRRFYLPASALGQADIARHFKGCHLRFITESRVRNALDDVAGDIRQAIPPPWPP